MRTSITLLLIGALAAARAAGAQQASGASFDTGPAYAALRRLAPPIYSRQIRFVPLDVHGGHDTFRITGHRGDITIAANDNATLLTGFNWYLKYVVDGQVSVGGDRVPHVSELPAPRSPIVITSPYAFRYALNENTDGYSSPYWSVARWQREIDLFSAFGVNQMLVERGTDAVLYQTFRDFGYSDSELRAWLVMPAHLNWELMGNMCCFGGPISKDVLAKRVVSAKAIIARLRAMGIQPVLPGYYGIVPADFTRKHPGAHVVAQGRWVGFTRPGWLDPRDPLFAKIAADFYRRERDLFGNAQIYDMEILQEGGRTGDVPIGAAARAIQNALEAAHPGARWMMLAWGGNPRSELLSAVDRSKLFIIDNQQDRTPGLDRKRDFQGAPYVFSGLWDFGNRTTMGANLYDYAVRLPQMGNARGSTMIGTAIFPEGLENNPVAFDLFSEMGWRRHPVDLSTWISRYCNRRYGGSDPHAQRAWQILLDTAYAQRADGVSDHGERDAAQESLFDARPSLTATTASSWSPDVVRYNMTTFATALPQLLAVAPALRTSATYRYDVVDVARQVLANRSRVLLPEIKVAYDAKNVRAFASLTSTWMRLMREQNELLATNRAFMLGPWLQEARAWASNDAERAALEYDARSILTTWGDRTASNAGLHDYADKDWAGLTSDFYAMRWKLYFDSLEAALRSGASPRPIDWFAVEDAWNHQTKSYPTLPHGDAYSIAQKIANNT